MRPRSLFFAAALILGCGAARVESKAPGRLRPLPGEPLELKTQDGWTLAARYSPAHLDRPTFILLHQAGGRKEEWLPLVRAMARDGFGALALDLRGHGASQNPPPGGEAHWWKFRISKDYNEWMNMGQDVDAAVAALKAQGVPEASIALGGSDAGSSVALRYAAVHKEVPMLFMLSPGLTYRELPTVNAMRLFGRRPILMVVGQDDRHSLPETQLLHQFAKNSAGEENALLVTAEREHGAKMLTADIGLVDRLMDWMTHPAQTAAPPAPPAGAQAPESGIAVPGVVVEPADSNPPQDAASPSQRPSSPAE